MHTSFVLQTRVLVRLPRDLKRRAAPGSLQLGVCSRHEERFNDPLVAKLGCDMDGAHGLWPPEEKTATRTRHLLLVHIQVPEVVESQPRTYLNQCLHLHQLSLCKTGRVDVNFRFVIWLLY